MTEDFNSETTVINNTDVTDLVALAQQENTSFDELELSKELLQGVSDLGFKYCTPIQAAILPYSLRGQDAIGKAQTGTGKTAAFLITIFDDLLRNPILEERFLGEPRALVIAPTRELVMQIEADAIKLGRHAGLKVVSLIGGADYQKQLNRMLHV